MEITIGSRIIGEGYPCFIIAEMSANHLQNFSLAVNIVKAAKKAGADAIKLQTFTPDTLTIASENEYFRIRQDTIWDGRTLYDLYKEAYSPWEWQPELKRIAEKEGLICFSTPYDKSSVDFLEEMEVPAYKVASFEITDIPLIEYIASKGKPVIISTGIARLCDIEDAVRACRRVGNDDIILLKCTSAYPAPVHEANLKTIPHLAETFRVISGLSDHTMGMTVPIGAAVLGAKVIEKHFTLGRRMGGLDATFSAEPEEFSRMVQAVREIESAMGVIDYELSEKSKKSRELARSLFVVADMEDGERFTHKNIRSIRPGFGLHPRYYYQILGKKANRDISRGTPLSWDLVSSE